MLVENDGRAPDRAHTRSSAEGRVFDTCPVCDARTSRWRTKNEKGRTYPIDRCVRCGFAFVNPRPTAEFLSEFYSVGGHGHVISTSLAQVLDRERVYPNSTVDGARLAARARALRPAAGRALDVGCGYGFVSQAAMTEGFDVTSLEVASVERAIATELLGREPVATSFENFEGEVGTYGVVFMSQVLEHALDPVAWVEKAAALLAPGGVFAIALPNFDSIFRLLMQEREPYICPPAHLNFFGARSLTTLLEKHGLRVHTVENVSRLSSEVLERRLRPAGRAAVALAKRTVPAMLGVFDRFERGQMLNVYAQK